MSGPVSVNNQFAHVGLAAYCPHRVARDPAVVERVAKLLVDPRWPWIPWYASFQGVHKRDDRSAVRVGGKNGFAALVEGMSSPRLSTLRMDRARGDSNFTSVQLPFDARQETWGREAPYAVWITCRSAALPAGKSFDAWLTLAHELVATLGALTGTIGAWPTFDLAIRDTWRTRMVLDTPRGDLPPNPLPADLDPQIAPPGEWQKTLGLTYARHPRWGTYLHARHIAAIGGVERIRAEVAPAKIEAVGELTYIQLTESIETAMTAVSGEKRLRLQALMAPIIVGAGQPPAAAI